MARKTEYSDDLEITSAAHATKMSGELESKWSAESQLSQRTLIYVARLLEEQNALLALLVHRLPPNKRVQPTRSAAKPKTKSKARG